VHLNCTHCELDSTGRTLIGERLKELRTARGISLRELASLAKVSPTLLSQIERSVTDPSLETMRRLAGVFGESVASLFNASVPTAIYVSRPGHRSLLTAPSGRVGFERLTAGNGQLEVLRAVLQPGETSAEEPRGHSSTECIYVISGTIVIRIDGVDYAISTGESISFDSRAAHLYLNTSDAPVEIIVSVTPPNP
jgi:transcriptional regulator with XRE-family HTH domain